jgi:uncharacterized protein DUF4236
MGLRFRRSWSVVPGIRFNLGLKSGSLSFGTRGLHYTVGTSGSQGWTRLFEQLFRVDKWSICRG